MRHLVGSRPRRAFGDEDGGDGAPVGLGRSGLGLSLPCRGVGDAEEEVQQALGDDQGGGGDDRGTGDQFLVAVEFRETLVQAAFQVAGAGLGGLRFQLQRPAAACWSRSSVARMSQ